MREVFEAMYQKKIWGGGSGVGSLPEATVRYRAVLQKLLADCRIRSVVDIGCGDWQTGSRVDWTGIEYTGIDIVPEVIEADRNRYGRRGRRFLCGNVLEMSPPAADLLIIKDVLQHWAQEDVFHFLPLMDQYPLALVTNDIEDPDPQKEILWTEHWRPLDLTKPPFNRSGEVLLVDTIRPQDPPKVTMLFRNTHASSARLRTSATAAGPSSRLSTFTDTMRRWRTWWRKPEEPSRDEFRGFSPRNKKGQVMDFRIAPAVEVIDDIELREAERESLNRLCNIVDWQAWGPLSTVMNQLADCVTIHRKSWEYAMCIHGLKKLGVVTPASTALAVGAGYERPLFYFANCIARMVATDLYDNPGHEGQPAMLTEPEQFAPFPYRKEALQVLRMPGDALDFEDNTFDFVFCLSSIEHFGSRATQKRSLEEMKRVVKPRGVIAIATELILNDATHHEYFTYAELEQMFLRAPGLQLVGGPLDLRIGESLVRYPVMLDSTKNPAVAPHIVLYSHGVLLTSVMLFLSKTA